MFNTTCIYYVAANRMEAQVQCLVLITHNLTMYYIIDKRDRLFLSLRLCPVSCIEILFRAISFVQNRHNNLKMYV